MKLIIGLGNPGQKYINNRHNAGFAVVDKMANEHQWPMNTSDRWKAEIARAGDNILAKPQTFMNESGQAVSLLANFYKVEGKDIYLIHDDLDIKLGEYKIQFGVGPKVHNGVSSVEKELGTKDFWRVRVGVDNREGNRDLGGDEYVLANFTKEEKEVLDEVIDKCVNELMELISK